MYGVYINKKNNFNVEENEYLSHSYSFRNWSGKRYDIFEIQHHKDLLGKLEKEFETTYDFKLENLYSGILKLKNNFYFSFENSLNYIRELEKAKKIKFVNNSIQTTDKINEKETKKLTKHISNLFGLELTNIKENTKWTKTFIDKFLMDNKYYKEFVNNISIENWEILINKVKYKSFLKIKDKYYLLLERYFYDSLDRTIIYGMCENISELKQQELRKKYTSNIEKIVAQYFNEILINGDLYVNNYYDYNQKIIENDILMIYDNNIFIIEVKAGNFTPTLAFDDFEAHKKSLKNLIENANKQQDNLEKCLLENKNISIYDSNNKRKRNKKTDIKINKDTKIFKIIVTAENFNDIEARADKVNIISLSPNTIVWCLDDLRIYSEYFKHHPCYFIQYLLQRRYAIGNKYIDLYDELYHLGMWLEYNHYTERINYMLKEFTEKENIEVEPNLMMICGEDWLKEIEKYYNNLWFKKGKIEKPFRKLPLEINKIIDYFEKNNNYMENQTYLAIFLLNLNMDTLKQIENIIIKAREFYKNTKRPKYRIYGIKNTR